MKKDGLAVEAEGDMVQVRQVSPIIVVPSQTQKRWGCAAYENISIG